MDLQKPEIFVCVRHIARHAKMHIAEAFKTIGLPEDAALPD